MGAITPDDLPNLQPFGALFFCGMVFFGVKWLWAPALAWFLTYPLTSALNGYAWSAQLLVPLLGFIAIVAFAKFFKGKSLRKIFFGSLGAALVFYLLTNTLSWALDPGYAKSAWRLEPGSPLHRTSRLPADLDLFCRNSLISQAVFTGAFMLAHAKPARSHCPKNWSRASGA